MSRIPDWVSSYVGLPFLERGRDRNGLDCWGLVRLVLAEQYGVFVPSYTESYVSTEDSKTLGSLIDKESGSKWIRVPVGQEQAGDVIVMRMRGHPMHVGLVLGSGEMLHIESGINSVMENYRGMKWSSRVTGFFQHAQQHGK